MLKPFLIVLVTLIVVPTIIWGFPGAWVFLALIPAFILGNTIAHFQRPRGEEGPRLRPGVLLLGSLFGLVSGMVAVSFMWASTAPEEVVIERVAIVSAVKADVWKIIGDPMERPRWNTWVADIDPKGKGGPPAVGAEYRSTMRLERHDVPGGHRIVIFDPPTTFAWTLEPTAGSSLENMVETLILEEPATGPESAAGGKLTIRYRLTYAVRSVFGRVLERTIVRQQLDKIAEESVRRLVALSQE
ncbi:MAG: hypothetical protein ACI9MR_001451 [Myxococcota bacterium]|jgi:hypothetical protein